MAKNKNAYETLSDEIAATVKKTKSTRHSKSDLVSMTQTLLNTPEHEIEIYTKGGDTVKSKPVERYRESLKPILKQFGIDKDEMSKIQEVKFDKSHAEAISELATVIVKDYTGTGRTLAMPITSDDEAQMSISQVMEPKKSSETKKIVEKPDGTYESVPTGKKKTWESHMAMKVKNKVPDWLTSEEDV